MKIKKFISIILSTTIAFTATLSSSASIFADDVEISQTDESLSFTSSFFDELLEQSEESIIENPDDYGISPMWLKEYHQDIIDYNVGDLPENHIRILKATGYWADKYFSDIKALHGIGNYVINLEFLWYFAVYLGKQNDPKNATQMNNAINAAKNSAIAKIKGTTAYKNKNKNNGENKLQYLIANCAKLVKYDGGNKVNSTKLKATEMKMRILGYASHLIGDVYAHRTMLTSISGLKLSYFKSSLKTDVSKGIVQFIDLNRHYLLDSNKKGEINKNYIDNPFFRPNRYNDAMLDISSLVTEKSSAFDYYWFLCPWSNNIKLNSFKKYVKNSGLDTSELTASQWAKYST